MSIALSKHHRFARVLPFCMALASMSLFACKKPQSKASPSASTSTAPGAAASGKATAAKTGAPSCDDYVKKVCEKAGQESATCQSMTTSAQLLSPAACTAALKDIDYSVKKLADLGKSCADLVQKLCAEVGNDSKACQLVSSQTKNFPAERCTMMLEHIPEIVGELRKMEQTNQPLSPDLQAAIAQGTAPAFGPETAKVKIVEFSDFQCPYCSRAAATVHQLKEKYGTRVRFVFRQFPLSFHQHAKEAAEASLAAHEQGKFWEFHDHLFKNQNQLERASLESYAKQVGLNVDKFKKSLDEHKHASTVDADMKLGEQVAVSGTPTLFINGERVADPSNFEAVSTQIEAALKAGG